MTDTDQGVELRVAAAKVAKYASRESGDTLEMVERPRGGLSFVLADGQTSGRGAKAVSNMVARKAVALLAEGVRDGAAVRAAHDYLFTTYRGKVRADLTTLSVDLVTRTIVVSRNTELPAIVRRDENWELLEGAAYPLGLYAATRPMIHEFPFQAETCVIVGTDGLWSAGGEAWDVLAFARENFECGSDPQAMAEALLAHARTLDKGRPRDDISVLVLSILARRDEDAARRLWVQLPL